MPTQPHNTDRLAELVRGKRAVLQQLHAVGERQGELIAAGDVAALLSLLAAKQRLLAGLQQVDRAIEPFREEDPDERRWPTPAAREACAADAQACRTLLTAVVGMERTHERQMCQRRDRVAEQLRQAHLAHDAGNAYRSHATTPRAAPLDLTSEG